jgi:hypothetical protein
MLPEGNRLPRDNNRIPLMGGISYLNAAVSVPATFDPATGAQLVTAVASAAELPSTIQNGQQTVTTSAVALPTGALTQGVILESLSTNTVSIFIGASGVTTSTGIELLPGASTSVAVNNTNLIYVICASTSPVISWIGS